MGGLSSIIKGIGKGLSSLNPISLVGDVIGAGASLISSNQANKYAQHMADKQIAAQKAMNEFNVQAQRDINTQNVESQERINQQQLDFAQGINDIMRHDSKHAISDKRADLMRSGYSTADPSLSGFSAASLSSPTLTAPQAVAPTVESEFTPQMAQNLISAKTSSLSNTAMMFQTLSDIALKRAQTSKTKSETVALDKSNAWLDLEKNALYTNILREGEKLLHDGRISKNTADELANQLTTFNSRVELLGEQVRSLKLDNDMKDITKGQLKDRLKADFDEVVARIDQVKATTDVQKVQKDLYSVQKDLDGIRLKFAKMGIDFNASDIFSSIAKIFASEDSKDLIPTVLNNLKEIISSAVEAMFDVPAKTVSNGISSAWNFVKSAGAKVADKLSGR